MTKKKRPNYSPEFRLETAQLIVDNGYTHEDAAKAMGVGYSTISKWVKQLKEERRGIKPKVAPMTAEQIKIRALKKQ
ncbi:MAG: transposase [Colwellia sp.]|jgi:transposase